MESQFKFWAKHISLWHELYELAIYLILNSKYYCIMLCSLHPYYSQVHTLSLIITMWVLQKLFNLTHVFNYIHNFLILSGTPILIPAQFILLKIKVRESVHQFLSCRQGFYYQLKDCFRQAFQERALLVLMKMTYSVESTTV